MSIYSFRAECMDDIKKVLQQCVMTSVVVSMNIKPGIFEAPTPPSDPEAEIVTDASLEQLREAIRHVVDGHVMLQTLRPCPLAENSLERDYGLH